MTGISKCICVACIPASQDSPHAMRRALTDPCSCLFIYGDRSSQDIPLIQKWATVWPRRKKIERGCTITIQHQQQQSCLEACVKLYCSLGLCIAVAGRCLSTCLPIQSATYACMLHPALVAITHSDIQTRLDLPPRCSESIYTLV
jgi:hypothetical protein